MRLRIWSLPTKLYSEVRLIPLVVCWFVPKFADDACLKKLIHFAYSLCIYIWRALLKTLRIFTQTWSRVGCSSGPA